MFQPEGKLTVFTAVCLACNLLTQEFNLSLLAPCLSLGMSEIANGQKSPLFEAARRVTLDRVTNVVQQLPAVHQVFQPFLPTEPTAYWSKLNDLFGNLNTVPLDACLSVSVCHSVSLCWVIGMATAERTSQRDTGSHTEPRAANLLDWLSTKL